jgi:citrate lyase subunit beta/citryl-CoA lyase
MSVRSFLFVPADSERKLAKAGRAEADALILDLEDAVVPARKDAARVLARAFLESAPGTGRSQVWVRINALHTRDALLDLSAIVRARPHGLVVPKVERPADLAELSKVLSELEGGLGIAAGSTRLIALLETPRGVLTVPEYLQTRLDRLSALSWGAEDLAAALEVRSPRDAGGDWSSALSHARIQCLMVARALAVDAIDTVTRDFRNPDALRNECIKSSEAGFSGKLAIHPDQVGVINAAYRPSPAALEQARRIIEAFDAVPGAGAVSLDGAMIDIVHLQAARRLLHGRGSEKT